MPMCLLNRDLADFNPAAVVMVGHDDPPPIGTVIAETESGYAPHKDGSFVVISPWEYNRRLCFADTHEARRLADHSDGLLFPDLKWLADYLAEPSVPPGVRFRKAREFLGFTQEQFGEVFGVSILTIHNWENGKPGKWRKTPPMIERIVGIPAEHWGGRAK